MASRRRPQNRRKRAAAPAPAAVQPPAPPPAAEPPQLQLSPAQSLQELALLGHRLNANLIALCKIEDERLAVERKQLEVQQELLGLTREARAQVAAGRLEGENTTTRLLELLAGVLGRGTEPRTASAPAIEPPEPVQVPARGLRVS